MLIVGCGYVGSRLAQHLAESYAIKTTAVVKAPGSKQELENSGIATLQCDLDSACLPQDSTLHERIFYFAPPPGSGGHDTRMLRFVQGLAVSGQPKRLVYISTTGVYGDCGGAWVDENSPIRPVVDRAKRRWHAETVLQAYRQACGMELVVLRVAGIYGPGKLPLERLRQQTPMVREQDAPWTNRIHVDDLVTSCIAAMQRGADGEAYNVCDDTPGNMADYFNRVADMAGLPRPPTVALAEAENVLSAGLLSYLRESRRISNKKLRDKLGVDLRYPALQAGLPGCVKETPSVHNKKR